MADGSSAEGSGASALAALGYTYVAGPSGARSDFVLRQIADPSAGFAWAGQENFNSLGKAVFLWAREMLVSHCGLEKLSGYGSAVPYATPGLAGRNAPILMLLCGDVPGCDAGAWNRRLCINNSTTEGAMFEYVFRAQERGWSVLVPDIHGASAPHKHMQDLWTQLLEGSAATRLLMVGHSYGGPVGLSLLKSAPSACERLGAVVTSDGMAWHVGGWDSIEQLDEAVPTEPEVRLHARPIRTAPERCDEDARAPPAPIDAPAAPSRWRAQMAQLASDGKADEESQQMYERSKRFADLAPAAFQPAAPAVRDCVAQLVRNYAHSTLPVGTTTRVEPTDRILTLSAGTEDHGQVTHNVIDHAFAYLDCGAAGAAAGANARARALGCGAAVGLETPASPVEPPRKKQA